MNHLRFAVSDASRHLRSAGLALALSALVASSAVAQNRPRQEVIMDSARAQMLYVSNEWEDHPVADYARAIEGKRVTDSIYAAVTEGVVDYRKITYKSRVDGMEIPAYLFQPIEKRGPRGHAAMVWVHGGVHGNMYAIAGTTMMIAVTSAARRAPRSRTSSPDRSTASTTFGTSFFERTSITAEW